MYSMTVFTVIFPHFEAINAMGALFPATWPALIRLSSETEFQDFAEGFPTQPDSVDTLEKSPELGIVQEQLVHERVDADALPCRFLLKSTQSLLIDPERLGYSLAFTRHMALLSFGPRPCTEILCFPLDKTIQNAVSVLTVHVLPIFSI